MNTLSITDCSRERIQMLEINQITPNLRQPRKSFDSGELFSLADSIYRHGILQPLSVRRRSIDESSYELVAGERRLRAAKLLKMSRVPCIVIDADERTSAVMAIIENIQRSNLNIFEEATAIQTLKEIYNMTQEKIAQTLSVSQSYVANKQRILRLSEDERLSVLENALTERHCRALIRITDPDTRRKALDHIVKYSLNVAAAEAYIDKLLSDKPKEAMPQKPKRLKDLRIFYNSIDRAVESVRNLGIDVISEIKESENSTEISLIIPKNGQ